MSYLLFKGVSCNKSSKHEPQFSFSTPNINKSKKLSSKCTSYNVSSKHNQKTFKSEVDNIKKNVSEGNKLLIDKSIDNYDMLDIEKKQLKEKSVFFDQCEKSAKQLIPSCRKNCRSRRKTLADGCSRRDKLESSIHKSGR